jgi:hypothetical protein
MIIIMIAERGREINKRPQQDTHTHTRQPTTERKRKKKRRKKKKKRKDDVCNPFMER